VRETGVRQNTFKDCFNFNLRRYNKALRRVLADDDIPDYLTPQVAGEAVRGRAGCVTDAAAPEVRPEGVRDMDVWIESLSEHPDKKNPMA